MGNHDNGPTIIEPRPMTAGAMLEQLRQIEARVSALRETLSTGRRRPDVAARAIREAIELGSDLAELAEHSRAALDAMPELRARFETMRDLVARCTGGRL